MEKTRNYFLKISKILVIILSIVFMLFLFLNSLLHTCYFNVSYDEILTFEKDNMFLNMLVIMIVVTVAIGLIQLLDRIKWLTPRRIIIIECILMGILCFLWVHFANNYSAADPKYVVQFARYMIDSNEFDQEKILELQNYIQKFPYQLGIVSLYEMYLRVFGAENSYVKIHYLHCICYIFSVYFMSKTTYEITQSKKVLLFEFLLILFCFPWVILTPYTYGDIPFFTMALGSLFFSLKFERKKQKRYLVAMIFLAMLACVFKVNAIIFVIALTIVQVLKSFELKQKQYMLLACLLLCLSVSALPVVKLFYQKNRQVDFDKGSPMYGNILMGLSESYNPGWYTGYVEKVYDRLDGNYDAMKDEACGLIQERLQEFENNIPYALDFFGRKITSQWNEPTYESFQSNQYFASEVPQFVHNIYFEKENEKVVSFMNRYQSILYGMFLLYIIFLIRKPLNSNHYIFVIYFIGGFLFQLFWEGKSRYVYPYAICMIPCAASAVAELEYLVKNKCWKRKKKSTISKVVEE